MVVRRRYITGMNFHIGRREGEAWVEEDIRDERGGKWTVAARLAVQDRKILVTELRLFPKDSSVARLAGEWRPERAWETRLLPGVTPKLLRRIPMGAFVPYVTSFISEAWESGEQSVPLFKGLMEQALPGVGRTLPPRPRPRRNAGLPDEAYAELAREYVEACQHSRRPLQDIAERHAVAPEKIRDRLHEARVRGLLSPGTPGQRGGHLLPRALALLSQPRKPKPKRPTRRKPR
jgi:hypothetical protein